MVKTFEQQEIANIAVSQLALNPGDLSGNFIAGGTIKDFGSTGIKDSATKETLVITDDKITVKSIAVDTVESNLTVRGDMKIYGILDAGQIRTTEIIANQRYEKQFLEFANPHGSPVGTGFLWSGDSSNKQFIYNTNPDRFFSSENIDLVNGKSFMIEGQSVIDYKGLGNGIVESRLQTVGTLRSLTVAGNINFGDVVHFNPVSERFSIGTTDGNGILTIYDNVNDVELIITGNKDSQGIIGTFSTKDLVITTDNQARITVGALGDVTIGNEGRDNITTRVYGKLGVGVKNPREQLEVAGNIRWANKLFAVGNQPPTDGHYQQGDVIWNTNPMSSSYIGWVCTVSGAPGLWKPFGMIAD